MNKAELREFLYSEGMHNWETHWFPFKSEPYMKGRVEICKWCGARETSVRQGELDEAAA